MQDLKFKDLIYIKKNALSEQECDLLIKEQNFRKDYTFYESCPHAVTGEMTESTYEALNLEPGTKNFDLIHKRTNDIINEWLIYLESFKSFHVHLFKNTLLYSHKLRLMRYGEGGWIHPHIDWDHFTHASCTFALNHKNEYEGGEFVFFNGNHTVELSKGDAMIFPADCFWVHEVKPIKKGVRYSTNSFITSLNEKNRTEINFWWLENRDTKNEFRYNIDLG